MSGGLRYVGHSTVLVELDGVRLLTDPMLRWRSAHLRRMAPIDLEELTEIDAVLVTHGHYDHLDLPSLKRVGRTVPIVLPRGLGRLLRRQGFVNVIEVEAGEDVPLGALTVSASEADHEGGRPPFYRATALGYAILGSSRLYFAGDTDLFDEMNGLVENLDVALLPVWGWGPTLGRGSHLDPERAAEAVRRLRPRIAVPIHWGTYAPFHLSLFARPTYLSTPGDAFAAAVGRVAPDVEVRVLAPGARTDF